MNVYRTILALLSILILAPFVRAQMPRMEHRFEGLVADAFMADDGTKVWTAEDGGRIRFRDGVNPWVYLDTPDEAQDTLRAIHFVPDLSTGWGTLSNLVGWTVGENPQIFKTINGGASWFIVHNGLHSQVSGNPYGHLRDIHFVRHPTDGLLGWLVGLNDIWKSVDGGANWSHLTLLDQYGNPINAADIELYAIDVLQCGSNEPIIVACAEPGLVFRNQSFTSSTQWGTVMEVVWDVRDQSEEDLSVCGSNAFHKGIHNNPPYRMEIWDIEFQRKCAGDPLLVMVAGGENLGGTAWSSTDNGSTFTKECHECEVNPSLCVGNTDYELTASHSHYKRHNQFNHLYGVAVFGDGSAVAGGYNGQHVVRRTDGVWEDRSQQGVWALEMGSDEPSFMFLNGAVSQRDPGSTSSNGKAFLVGQGGQGRSTTAAKSTTPTPPNPPGQPGENWSRDWTAGEQSGWWRMEATAFNTTLQGWRTGQNYHVARTPDGGLNWALENVLPHGYHFTFRSIAVGPNTAASSGSGVAVGVADPRDLALFGYGCSPQYVGQPKVLRRDVPTPGVVNWIEPNSIKWLSSFVPVGKDLKDVAWAATLGPDDVYWACGQGEMLLRSTDNGHSWFQFPLPSGSPVSEFNALAFFNQDKGFLVGKNPSTGVACAYAVDAGATPPTYSISPSAVVELFDVAFDTATNTTYAVGTVNTANGIRGQVFSSTLSGSVFSSFAAIAVQPSTAVGVEPCGIGDSLGLPPLNAVAIATNGDLWVGGECGRVWRRDSAGNWDQVKSQTDGHILDLATAPGGYVYATSMRTNLTGPGLVRWNPGPQ